MAEQNIYGTMNLYEAAYCLARGFKMTGKKREGAKTVVYFEGPDVRIKAMDYYNGGKIEAKAYSDSYRTLKDYVFER